MNAVKRVKRIIFLNAIISVAPLQQKVQRNKITVTKKREESVMRKKNLSQMPSNFLSEKCSQKKCVRNFFQRNFFYSVIPAYAE
ncbi:MAG: hypothetical protein ACOYNL_01585 [Rickettsiales bacterium]